MLEVALDSALAPLGLSTPQWGTLRIIYENPGVSGADIARIAIVTPQAVATMLQRLEQAGLIARHHPPRGRALETHLTPRGKELLHEGERIARKVEAKLLSSFTAEEQEQLDQYLLRCCVALE